MRAVNLIPEDPRSARARGGDRPIGVYVLIAGLAVLVAFVAVWTMLGKQVDDRSAHLQRATAEAQVAEARVAASAKYAEFAQLARNRVLTVASLSATRFDWANGLREVSRVLPTDVWLMALTGKSGASEAAPTPGTSAAPAPTFEIQGCARSQSEVARLMTRLRAIDRVRAVDLRSSTKPDASGNQQCPADRTSDPIFTIVIRFAAPGESGSAVDSTGQISTALPAGATPGAAAAPNATPANNATKGAG